MHAELAKTDIFKELIFRITAFVLLRLYLVITCCEIIASFIYFAYKFYESSSYHEKIHYIVRTIYFMLHYIFEITVTLLGIHGVDENRPGLLEGFFFYNCYLIFYQIAMLLILIIRSTWFESLWPFYNYSSVIKSDSKIAIAGECVASMVCNILLAFIIKSCASTMHQNQFQPGNRNYGSINV